MIGSALCGGCNHLKAFCTCDEELILPDTIDTSIVTEKVIDEDLPEIIKSRMKEENAKLRIRNKRKSIREMLRR